VDFVGFLWKTPRSAEFRFFFCPSFRFSNGKKGLSTELFQGVWITIFYLFERWKVSKTVFNSLLKTPVDMPEKSAFGAKSLCDFLFYAERRRGMSDFFRKIRTKFRFSTFSDTNPQAFENLVPKLIRFHRTIPSEIRRSENTGCRNHNSNKERRKEKFLGKRFGKTSKSTKRKNNAVFSYNLQFATVFTPVLQNRIRKQNKISKRNPQK